MSRVDNALSQHPRDAQLRFLKGLILTEQNKAGEAIVVFSKLSEDYPELPEPYNNLAVLYAAGGQYDKARIALEMAIRTNPTYATAHENLGDIYARLASQAYDKALQLDSGNSSAKSKLTLVRTLVANPGAVSPRAAGKALPGAIAKTAPSAAAKAAPGVPAKTASAPLVTAPPLMVAKADLKASAKSETKAPESKADARAKADGERDEVLKAIHSWAKAWSAKDIKTYLASYDNDFQTPKGEPRKAWAEERRTRIVGKGTISVLIETPQVSIEGNTATVKFRQVYVSDRLTANSRKVITLVKQGGKWLIKQERAAS